MSYCSLSSVDIINALFSVYICIYISMDGIWCELCKYFKVSLLNIRSDVTMLCCEVFSWRTPWLVNDI